MASHSGVDYIRKNGEVYAVTHGTRSRSPEKSSQLETKSTYGREFRDASTVKKDGTKLLTPYHPNAARSRLPVHFHVTNNSTSHVAELLKDPRPDQRRYVTTNTGRYLGLSDMPVGMTNSGIVADKTNWLHHLQSQ
mmetsp:Transcript_22135/g.36663  ORF Transcript_22135/g.36663 Transcript_22135/m.36663 type:complete len:136 (+) Transcript_22135:51-458(+)|eukprot:CAMPEP_0184660648 /NCGR_PEP_ID=MMETSP0308-20130426/34586_1 /TAXON_ID=38269 /ORGANISM="Gloeochaete witrockiana, Strain SAG 46.84" /LENGTH=135 /DNA_ID=CAMNT_0027101363 /DNA_START=49 /DNA_END=456 /DNA_ORIENTATION=-